MKLVGICILLSLLSCAPGVEPVDPEKFDYRQQITTYDGTYPDYSSTPIWLKGRNYNRINVKVSAPNLVIVDSITVTIENLDDELRVYWSKIESDKYKGVLEFNIISERNAPYSHYQEVYRVIMRSIKNVKIRYAEREFGMTESEYKSNDSITQVVNQVVPTQVHEGGIME